MKADSIHLNVEQWFIIRNKKFIIMLVIEWMGKGENFKTQLIDGLKGDRMDLEMTFT